MNCEVRSTWLKEQMALNRLSAEIGFQCLLGRAFWPWHIFLACVVQFLQKYRGSFPHVLGGLFAL